MTTITKNTVLGEYTMKTTIFTFIFVLLIPAVANSGTLVVGRVDNIQDGSTQGWSSNAGHDIIPGGGPAGQGDNYLQIYRPTSSAPYPFHLGTKNTSTWTGDYISAGVQAITMDVNAISITTGPANLSLRIVLFGPGGAFSTKEPVTVSPGDGWQHVEFGLTRSDLVKVPGAGTDYFVFPPETNDLTETLRQVETLLIRHDSTPDPTPIGQHPEHILAALGIDNITAVLGPAPSYDMTWTFGNSADESYILERFEPADSALGDIGTENPTLLLHLGRRYQVIVSDSFNHPFELIAKSVDPLQDEVLLSAGPGRTGSLETDTDIKWFDNGEGTVAFTLTKELHDALTTRGKSPGYRCGLHTLSMRGDIEICTIRIASDLNRDCKLDFLDLELFATEWLEYGIAE